MTHDLIVIGAGPAGMAAAATASELGLKVALVDEQPRPGGQIYRNVGVVDSTVKTLLGPDYVAGGALVTRLNKTAVDVRSGALVWDVDQKRNVTVNMNGRSERLQAPHLLIATGAQERPSPVPGWTLPGVLNAGAAQIALKSGPSVPDGRIVLVGAGPLLLLVGCQLLAAGANLVAIVETAPNENRTRAMRHFPAALRAPKPLFKGLRMLAKLRSAGIPWYKSVTAVSIEGEHRVREVHFKHRGQDVVLKADVALLHHGVVPNSQLTRLLGLEHKWSDTQLAWIPARDSWGKSALEGVWIAGDGGGIDGARAAEATGTLAALGVAHALGRIDANERDKQASPWTKRLKSERAVRPFLDALYRPPAWIGSPPDETLVCRCEEVDAGRVREMATLGCAGPNQTKFFSRCGMGPCQGRMCGITVTQILAEARGVAPQDIGAYRVRAPIKPIPLHSLAALDVSTSEATINEDASE
ncbi:(2Fe-2S)-binding protein [Caballeronia sordidicola]|uniref:(2Fe-2S)-binding protein n=1 Tax=Caballeronia sordidicola TaxID=196367 RepID=A0A158FGA6_CABSO|nr:FAD-dependent oxidoreductase [Caballeronia sordidicola]SAL18731.1 (2Fe-2S)-binding protein [Caballeronia sordidicola]